MAVASSDLITTVEEAREYYREKLGGLRRITCHGMKVPIVFDVEMTHFY